MKRMNKGLAIFMSFLLCIQGLNFNMSANAEEQKAARIIEFNSLDESIAFQTLPIGTCIDDVVFPDSIKAKVETTERESAKESVEKSEQTEKTETNAKKEEIEKKEQSGEAEEKAEETAEETEKQEQTEKTENNAEKTETEKKEQSGEAEEKIEETEKKEQAEETEKKTEEPENNDQVEETEKETETAEDEAADSERATETETVAEPDEPEQVGESKQAEEETSESGTVNIGLLDIIFPAIIAHAAEDDESTSDPTSSEIDVTPVLSEEKQETETNTATEIETDTNPETETEKQVIYTEITIENVTWQEAEGKQFDSSNEASFTFEPVFTTNYAVDAALPTITVNIVNMDLNTAFERTAVVDGVCVSVIADTGVFPDDATLSVEKVVGADLQAVEEAVDKERADDKNKAESYTFDIKVIDKDGNEIEPDNSKGQVKVSFTLEEVANVNLETDVYHVTGEVGDLSVDKLETTETDKTTVEAVTDGFSFYTVEFTYGNLQYVLKGDSSVPLSDILQDVGLSGEVTNVSVSNEELISVSNETGEWIVTANQAFSTEEWLKVTLDGVEFEIVVTDSEELVTSVAITSLVLDADNTIRTIGVSYYWNHTSTVDQSLVILDKNRPDQWDSLRGTYKNADYQQSIVNTAAAFDANYYAFTDTSSVSGNSTATRTINLENTSLEKNKKYYIFLWTKNGGSYYGEDVVASFIISDERVTYWGKNETGDGTDVLFSVYVASVTAGETTTNYTDFATAVSAWNSAASGSTLTLLADVETSSTINVRGTKALDLKGHKLTLNGKSIEMTGTDSLEIKDTGTGGEIIQTGTPGIIIGQWSQLTISGGKLTGSPNNDAAIIYNNNDSSVHNVTLSGGEMVCRFSDAISLYGSGTINLTGGKITSTSTQSGMTTSSAVLPRPGFTGTVNWSGTEITTNVGCGIYVRDTITTVNITGGTFTTTGINIPSDGGYAVSGNAQGTINISGSPALGGKGIYLLNDKKITVTNTLSNSTPIGVTMQTPGVFTNSTDTSYTDASKFTSDNASYAVSKNADGQLELGTPTDYGLYVGNEHVTSAKTSGTGWSYDASTNTLTLNNYSFNGLGQGGQGDPTAIQYIPTDGTFNIVLNGTNTVTQNHKNNGTTWGIYCRADFTIGGDGILNVSTQDGATRAAAIYSEKNLTIKDSCTINAISGTVTGNLQGYGIGGGAGKILTIGGNAKVTLTGPKGGTEMLVKNSVPGFGWTDTDGNNGKEIIEVSTSGQNLISYQKIQFPTTVVTVNYKVINGTWADDTTEDKTESIAIGLMPVSVPTGMKASEGYTGGAWDTNPAETTITGATTFTYSFEEKPAATVKKAPTAKTLTYTGSAQELVAAGETEGGTMYYALGENATTAPADNLYTTSIPTGTDAGTYYVWYMVYGDINHNNSAPACVSVTISKAEVTAPSIASKTYNGQLQTATVAASTLYSVTTNEGGTNAGNYDVVLTLSDAANYKWTDSEEATKTLTFTINKANAVPAAITANNRTYDGTEKPIVTASSEPTGGEMRFALGENATTAPEAQKYTTSIPTATDAKTYYVWYKVMGDSNHNDSDPMCVVVTIDYVTVAVTFDANGGMGTMEDQILIYNVEQALTANAFTRDDYSFSGWNTKADGTGTPYIDEAGVALTDNLTLYAQWSAKPLYRISGTVKQGGNAISGVTIRLVKGSKKIAVTSTNASGEFSFSAPEDVYNIIAEKDGKTNTTLVTLNQEQTIEIIMPSANVNSLLVLNNGNTPNVMVGGLDELAETYRENGKTVTVTMTVEEKSGDQATGSAEIKNVADGMKLEYLDIYLTKTLDSTESQLTEANSVLEIVVPYDFSKKKQTIVKVYRYHGSSAMELAENDSKADGTYQLDKENNLVYIYANLFSTYAIGFIPTYTVSGNIDFGSFTGTVSVSLTGNDITKTEDSTVTNGSGSYSFTGLPAGTYNVTASWKEGGKAQSLTFTVTVPAQTL